MDYFGMPRVESPRRPTYPILDLEYNRIKGPGDGSAVLAMALARDIAQHVAAAVDLPHWPKTLTIIGSQITIDELVDLALATKPDSKDIKIERHLIDAYLSHSVPFLPSNEPMSIEEFMQTAWGQ